MFSNRHEKCRSLIEEANRVADGQAAANGRALSNLMRVTAECDQLERNLIEARAHLAQEQRRHQETQAVLDRLLSDLSVGSIILPEVAGR